MPHFLKYSPLKQQNKPHITFAIWNLILQRNPIIRCFAIFESNKTNWQSKINIKFVKKKYIEQKTVCKIAPQRQLGWLLRFTRLILFILMLLGAFWRLFSANSNQVHSFISIKRARLLRVLDSVNRSAFVKKSIFNY